MNYCSFSRLITKYDNVLLQFTTARPIKIYDNVLLQGHPTTVFCKTSVPKISPGAYIFQKPFWGGLYSEGTRENLRFKIDWASLILGRKFTVFLCFTLYLRAISKYKPPGGLIFGGAI